MFVRLTLIIISDLFYKTVEREKGSESGVGRGGGREKYLRDGRNTLLKLVVVSADKFNDSLLLFLVACVVTLSDS